MRRLRPAKLAFQTSPHTDWTTAIRDHLGGESPSAVVDATGTTAAICDALELVVNSGTVVIVGSTSRLITVPSSLFTRKEINLTGSCNNNNVFAEAVALVRRNRSRVASLVTHELPVERAAEAFTFVAEHPERVGKAVITFTR